MRAYDQCAARLAERHPHHAARLLERIAPREAGSFLAGQPPRVHAAVLVRMSPGAAAACLDAAGDAAARAVAELPRGAAGVVLRRLGPDARTRVLAALPAGVREALERGLRYADRTAGAVADVDAPAVAQHLTAGDARRALRGVASAPYPYVYVTDDEQRLVGVLHVRELADAPAGAPLAQMMATELVALPATAALAAVATHPGWREFDALPVVEPSGVFLGVLQHRHVRGAAGPVPGGSLAGTLFHLGELYWVGLSMWVPGMGPAASSGAAHSAGVATGREEER